jgi:S1-C subfamily serine protease
MGWDTRGFDRQLAAAVDVYDRRQVEELCDRLVEYLQGSSERYPVDRARSVLRQLRRKRWFDLMTRIAEAFLQAGQCDPAVRGEYAQALIDQGMPAAAVELLKGAADESTESGVRAEVCGMLGRAYKQMGLAASPGSSRRRELLARAALTYANIYVSDPAANAWHGVNAAALVRFAQRHEIDIAVPIEVTAVARQVLDTVEAQFFDPAGSIGPWGAALAAEAGLILGLPHEAICWMQRYVVDSRADAFELASTLRQFTEVWELDSIAEPGTRMLAMLRAQMLARQEGASLELTAGDIRDSAAGTDAELEKVLGDAGMVTQSWYRLGLQRSRAVALLRHRSGRAVGTGFLVDGSELSDNWTNLGPVLVTNSHVVSPAPLGEDSLTPEQTVVSFQAGAGDGSSPADASVDESLWSSPPRSLDCTILRLADPIPDIEPCPVTPFRPRLDGKQRVYVIGHPQGRELSFSIDDNLLLDYDESVIHYRAPTEHGSSGSPVFNRDWEVMGLHHAGRSDMGRLHGREGTYPANEGIWLQAIRSAIAKA